MPGGGLLLNRRLRSPLAVVRVEVEAELRDQPGPGQPARPLGTGRRGDKLMLVTIVVSALLLTHSDYPAQGQESGATSTSRPVFAEVSATSPGPIAWRLRASLSGVSEYAFVSGALAYANERGVWLKHSGLIGNRRMFDCGPRDEWGAVQEESKVILWRYRSSDHSILTVQAQLNTGIVAQAPSAAIRFADGATILAVAATDDGLVFVSQSRSEALRSLWLTRFSIAKQEQVWHVAMANEPPPVLTRPLRIGREKPLHRGSSSPLLAVNGATIVAVDPASASCFVVGASDGKIQSRATRVWSYDLVYRGPSTWNYAIAKFGEGGVLPPANGVPIGSIGVRPLWNAASRIAGEYVSGPYVSDLGRIAILCKRYGIESELQPLLDEYLLVCFAPDLQPIGLETFSTPAPFVGPACEAGTLAVGFIDGSIEQYSTSSAGEKPVIGPSSDRRGLAKVAWRPGPIRRLDNVWLVSESGSTRFRAMPKSGILRVDGTGYVDSHRRTMTFYAAYLNCDVSEDQLIALKVPFSQELEPPRTNFTLVGDVYHTSGTFALRLDDIYLSTTELFAVVVSETSDTTILHLTR